jgi:hypothetical protein
VREGGERGEREVRASLFQLVKNQKLKLNSDYTIKFVAINSSKQDLTWIYLDKIYL